MAKTKKPTQPIEKKSKTKDLKKAFSIKLERLDRETIDRYLNPNVVTHTIAAKIHRDKIQINGTTIASSNRTFNIDIKIANGTLSVEKSQVIPVQIVSTRTLRTRKPIGNSLSKKMKPNRNSNMIVAQQTKPTSHMIDKAWRKCKIESAQAIIRPNDVVMAKLKGYSAWPAVVLKLQNKKAKVEFFGAHVNEKLGLVNLSEVTPIVNAAETIGLLSMRNNVQFDRAIHEAKRIMSS